jgi:hypothetical protein
MLYSNTPIRTDTSRSTEIYIGANDKEHKAMMVKCITGMEIRAAVNHAHDIIFNNNEPVITNDFGKYVCMLLSTKGVSYSVAKPGFIKILNKHRDQICYKSGKGEFKTYTWPCAVLKFPLINTIVQVNTMGSNDVQFYFIHGTLLYECDLKTIQALCISFKIEVPCTINTSKDGILFVNEDEWLEL